MTRFEALKLVVDGYGSQEATAEALGVCQSTVSRWLSQSKQMPAAYVLQAERDTGVSRHHLRPDIYPRELHGSFPRWHGVDLSSAPDITVVAEWECGHNGNRIKTLARSAGRRAAR